ncbi:MAG TPA: hypothetical protein VF637_15745 [Sphingomicrobium sp.]|jgi:hypothetical protein
MASVDLTGLRIDSATPAPLTFGGVQRPATGGAVTRIQRMGSRWSFTFTTPPMPIEPDYRIWSAQFDRAENDGALMRILLPGFSVGTPGSPTVASTVSTGRSVALTGVTANYVIRAGQWISFVVGGVRYLDRIAQQVAASSTGTATIVLKNLIRVPMPAGTVAELAVPKIEGSLEYSSVPTWTVDRLSMFAFTITEDA